MCQEKVKASGCCGSFIGIPLREAHHLLHALQLQLLKAHTEKMVQFLPIGRAQPNAGRVLLSGVTLEYLRLHLYGQDQKSKSTFGASGSLAMCLPCTALWPKHVW